MSRATAHFPHDAVFKSLLSDRATAADFLLIHLPENLRELCRPADPASGIRQLY